jgi:hypothetical protein
VSRLSENRSGGWGISFAPAAEGHGLWPWRFAPSFGRDAAPQGRSSGTAGFTREAPRVPQNFAMKSAHFNAHALAVLGKRYLKKDAAGGVDVIARSV